MATQNPIEQEGSYPLPEAQMDRFLLHVYIDYGSEEAEAKVIRLVRGEEVPSGSVDTQGPVAQQVIFDARQEINRIQVPGIIEKYILDLIFTTRLTSTVKSCNLLIIKETQIYPGTTLPRWGK